MNVTPVRRESLPEAIVASIRGEILGGRLEPGERLPAERQLAQRLETNRNTLREALRRLEALHLVAARQGDGVIVRDFREEGEITLLPYFLAEGADPGERAALFAELLMFRRLVLAEAAALAAERASPEEAAAIARAAEGQRDVTDRTLLVRNDLEFFRLLVVASRSLLGRWLFNTFVRVYETFLDRLPDLWVVPDGYVDGLVAVAGAISGGDAEGARRRMVEHLQKSEEPVMALLQVRRPEGGRADGNGGTP